MNLAKTKQEQKRASATKKLVKHAANLKVPVNKDFANNLIQHVYSMFIQVRNMDNN